MMNPLSREELCLSDVLCSIFQRKTSFVKDGVEVGC